jgi:hypothetical protein
MKLVELSGNVKRIATEMNEDELVMLLRKEARNAYDAVKRQPIFTKVETKDPFFVVDPAKSARKSKFIIDELTGVLPSWRGWTSRLHSVRGWTSKALADSRGSGQLCLLIPFDGSRVHTSKGTSFYRSFEKAHGVLEVEKVDNSALNDWLKSLHAVVKQVDDEVGAYVEPESAAQFMKLLEKLDKHRESVNKLKQDDIKALDRQHLRRALAMFSRNLPEQVSRLLDPDDNGFKTITSLYNLPENAEVWTGGKCVVITLAEYENMIKRGGLK